MDPSSNPGVCENPDVSPEACRARRRQARSEARRRAEKKAIREREECWADWPSDDEPDWIDHPDYRTVDGLPPMEREWYRRGFLNPPYHGHLRGPNRHGTHEEGSGHRAGAQQLHLLLVPMYEPRDLRAPSTP